MAASDSSGDDSLYPIAVLIDELRNEDVQVINQNLIVYCILLNVQFSGELLLSCEKMHRLDHVFSSSFSLPAYLKKLSV